MWAVSHLVELLEPLKEQAAWHWLYPSVPRNTQNKKGVISQAQSGQRRVTV